MAGLEPAISLSMIDIVLFQPEIPPNTGNVIRMCANTGFSLHLIEPLGFELEDKKMRRAGLDYHEWANVKVHANFVAYCESEKPQRIFAIETNGSVRYDNVDYRAGDALLFGQETKGIPEAVMQQIPREHWLRLPMRPGQRSLNLSNAVAVTVFEAWRHLDFRGGV